MKVLIVGGMGIIGGAITEAARLKDYDVYVLSRRPVSENYKDLGVKGIQGNWKDDGFVGSVLKNKFDVIVDTLVFNASELKRALQLVDGYCKQYIYISTDAVYNHPGINVSEDNSIDISQLRWNYGRQKREAEVALLQDGGEYSFSWTVVRPTMTFGDKRVPVGFGSRKNEWTLIDRILNNKPILNFDNSSLHAMCHSITFGNAVVELFLNDNSYGEFFHISDNKSVVYRDVFKTIENCLGVSPIIIDVNVQMLRSLSPSKYFEIIYDKNPEFTLDNSKIKKLALNLVWNIDFEKAINSEIQYLRNNCSTLSEDTEYNMITDSILLSYKRIGLTKKQKEQVMKYLSSLSGTYLISLRKYRLKSWTKTLLRPLYRRIVRR